MALKHVRLPYTEQGAKMTLTAEQKNVCKVLYKNIEDDLYEFAGLYDPEIPDEDYPDGIIALPIQSVVDDTEFLNQNTSVWNVCGSTGDPCPNSLSWYQLWENTLKEKGHPHEKKCYVAGSAGIQCNSSIIGGHMVLTNNIRPAGGSDGIVYIIPICSRHNHYANTAEMHLCCDVWALKLNRYFQSS